MEAISTKPRAQVICGDVIEVLDQLPAKSVHCIITSPPYYGLRDYGIPPRVWGGDPACVHTWGPLQAPFHPGQVEDTKYKNASGAGAGGIAPRGQFCQCGAWQGCLGLEPTLNIYLSHLTEVFRHAKRVLRDDGTLWLNLGDSYAGGGRHDEPTIYKAAEGGHKPVRARQKRLTGKDLLMVPARAAIALQDDGWVLRQDNIWAKGLSFCEAYSGSVMPESTRDRTTWSHEHIFHLALNIKYFYDIDAGKEPYVNSTVKQLDTPYRGQGRKEYERAGVQNPSDVKRRILDGASTGTGRNLRNVWAIGKQAFKGAHFATFPERLVTPIIKLATSEKGCCATCGAPRVRKVLREAVPQDVREAFEAARVVSAGHTGRSDGHTQGKPNHRREVLGTEWEKGCACEGDDAVPSVVLDIFAGSGRAGIAAVKLGRNFLGIDVKPEYVVMAQDALREAGAEVLE